MLQLALATEHCPHVDSPRYLERCQHLGSDTSLEQAQGPVLAVARGGHQLDVRVRNRRVEGLGQKGWLSHGHLTTRSDIHQAITNLDDISKD